MTAYAAFEPARSMTPLGCVRRCISGFEANSLGSRYRWGINSSRRSRTYNFCARSVERVISTLSRPKSRRERSVSISTSSRRLSAGIGSDKRPSPCYTAMGKMRRKRAFRDMRQVCPVWPRKRSFEFCRAMPHRDPNRTHCSLTLAFVAVPTTRSRQCGRSKTDAAGWPQRQRALMANAPIFSTARKL